MKTKLTKISALLMLAFATTLTFSSCGDKTEEATEQTEENSKCEEGKCEEGKCEDGKSCEKDCEKPCCKDAKCEEGKKCEEGMKCEEGKCGEGK